MTREVDARGLACPQPVINTKKALENIDAGEVVTIVDNEAARENVLKLAGHLKCGTSVSEKSGAWYITIVKGETGSAPADQPNPQASAASVQGSLECGCVTFSSGAGMVIMVTNRFFGQGSDELGQALMGSFMYSLLESNPLPTAIILANSGAYLSCQDSPVLEHLRALAQREVEILTCGTCLDYYRIKDKLAVGSVTNMYSIVERLNSAARVVNI